MSRARWSLGLVALAGLLGCSGPRAGRAQAAPPNEPASSAPSQNAPPNPNADALSACGEEWGSPDRRLSHFELAYAVEDVFGVSGAALRALPAPVASVGNVPDILVGRLLDTSENFLLAYRAAVANVAPEAAKRLTSSCSAAATNVSSCVAKQLAGRAMLLWRRSLTAKDLADLERAIGSEVEDLQAAFARGVVHVLSSEQFYLLQNEGLGAARTVEQAAARRLASRLALALWSSVPDRELLERAESGALEAEAAFDAEVRRMQRDARFSRFSREFSRQWLRLDRRPLFRPSLESRALVEDGGRLARYHEDLARFLAHVLASERPVAELLNATDPELNPTASERAGLITSRAVLSSLSTPLRGGGDEVWLGRGLVVQSSLLCRSFPLAAIYPSRLFSDHPLLDPKLTAASPRPGEPGLLAIRTHDKPCRECHRQLETIGAALSQFDGFGEASSEASATPVDIAGQAVRGPRELAAWIANSARFEPCVAQKLLSYVLGRAVLPARRSADRCLVERLARRTVGNPATLADWLRLGLRSPQFRSQGRAVVRDTPNPRPNSTEYTDALPPLPVSAADCASFEPARFLVANCGSAACHGEGARSALFAVADERAAATLLRRGVPSRDGYCADESAYLNPREPEKSLVIRKVTSGPGLCGAPMPIANGPHSLDRVEHGCFVRWVTSLVRQ